MWWPPGDGESQTASEISRLQDRFQSDSRMIKVVHALGSTTGADRRRVPLLVLDQSFAPEDPPDRPPLEMPVPFDVIDSDIKLLLRDWDIPQNTLVLFSSPPVATRPAPGTLAWTLNDQSSASATIGFLLSIGQRAALTTAGHLVEDLPCAVFVRHRRWFRPDRLERIGSIQQANDPRRIAGVDIAVIELADDFVDRENGQAELAEVADVEELTETVLRGGKSFEQKGWILGALTLTRELDGRICKNCWNVVGVEDGFAQKGDSGGAVVLDNGKVLGHLVAALEVATKGMRRQCGVVQDVNTTLEYLASTYQPEPVVIFG
jgi:hypothetical protein